MSILDKIMDLDRRILWWLLVIAVAIPLIKPLGLPIVINPSTQNTFDIIEALPEDSVVVIAQNTQASNYPESGPGWVALTTHLQRKNVKNQGNHDNNN